MTPSVLGLFSGIGGFELGFERAGFKVAGLCDNEPWAQAILKKHWPRIPLFTDVRDVSRASLAACGIRPDVITGGFPCQDISVAGRGAGLGGARSGLWTEYLRIIEDARPRYVVAENVSALRSRGLGEVLRGLSEIGYDAEWHCIPASAVGAPHRRDRIWIVAHPHGDGARRPLSIDLAGEARSAEGQEDQRQRGGDAFEHRRETMAHAHGEGLAQREGIAGYDGEERAPAIGSSRWAPEPDILRVASGVPLRVDRIRGLGNAVVPQIPEAIARAIMADLRG